MCSRAGEASGTRPSSQPAAKSVVRSKAAGKGGVHAFSTTPTVQSVAMHGFDGSVFAMAQAGDTLYAATSDGLLTSGTAGQTWSRVSGVDKHELMYVAAAGASSARALIVAGSLNSVTYSMDGGKDWKPLRLPPTLTHVAALAADGTGAIWIGGREGLFASSDGGATWETLRNLSIRDVNNLHYDAASQRVIVTAGGSSTMAFAVHLPERSVKFWDTGWNLRFARPVGDHLISATLFDGIVVQPQMVDWADVAKH